jgi:ABC-type polysaccharide/polyol phosphate transport system ATPase subunit
MSDVVLKMNNVCKKFKRGQVYDSLRDFVPGLFGRLLSKGSAGDLARNEFWALYDICMVAKRGEAVGIIGKNGAGKSTILKLLNGILTPDRGILKVEGRLASLIEVGAGFHPDLTGRENIFLNGTILGMKRAYIKRRLDEIVAFSELDEFIDTPVKRYSSGMFARLGFSVAAHLEPDVLVVDEVLSVGDYAFQNKCLDKMKAILKGGATILFVSHNLRAVAEMCDRCILLDKGRIIMEGEAGKVVQFYLDKERKGNEGTDGKEAIISDVVLRGENGSGAWFRAGEKAFLEIEVTGKEKCTKLSVSVALMDENYYRVFDTSTERLNKTTFSLEPCEKKKISFEMNLHLGAGTYHFTTYIIRYDIQKTFDLRLKAATIYVTSDSDVRGAANLYPKASIG